MEEWADVMILVCDSTNRVPGLGTDLVTRGVAEVTEGGPGVKVRSYPIN